MKTIYTYDLRRERVVLMKKIIAFLLAAAMAAGFLKISAEGDAPLEITAKAALLMDKSSGQVLYEQNADERLPIASLTKIMTLLLAAEALEKGAMTMEDMIQTSAYASSMDGSVIWLESGEEMSAYDMLRSVVISSANDACVAVAEYLGGNEEEFVKQMNGKAKALGMSSTHFVNCVGYDDPDHYSTARDIAKMAAELRKYDVYDEFLLTRLSSVRTDTERETQLLNTNKLITGYNGITGLKTGTTDGAGYCFVGTAKRGEMELIAVILGAESDSARFEQAEALLDYGFTGFEVFTPQFDSERLAPIEVTKGTEKTAAVGIDRAGSCIIPKGSSSKVKYNYAISKTAEAEIKQGQKLGKIQAVLDEQVIFETDVVAIDEVQRMTFLKSLELIFDGLFTL